MSSIFISVPLKRTKEVDVTNSLKNFISSNISTADHPEDCTKEISELNKLRNNAVCKTFDKTEANLETIERYYDQLDAMETKMPFDETHVPQAFKWKSAFESMSLFNMKSSLTMVNGQFEKACVLFNVAAMQCGIACVQTLDQDSNLKLAIKYFQMASGTFSYIKDSYIGNGKVQSEALTLDLTPECLNTLSSLMIAQAQEVFVKKAKDGNSKPLLLAKICQQGADLYADTLKYMSSPNLKGLWDKEWLSVVTCKQHFLTALAQYYAAIEAKNEKRFGDEISRINFSLESLKLAQKHAPSSTFLSMLETKLYGENQLGKSIELAYEKSTKDNNFIYHERICKPHELEPLPKAVLAKPIVPTFPLSGKNEFTDLFQKIVPIPVNQALVIFETRKSDLINTNITKLRQATQNLNGFLVAMNLPASLEDITGPLDNHSTAGKSGGILGNLKDIKDAYLGGPSNKRIPRSLLNKSNSIKKHGGIVAITKPMGDLPQLLNRNKEILAEALRVLDEERNSDNQLKTQFGSRWVRTPSDKLQTPLREEARKYNQIIEAAVQADEIVRNKFEQHRKIIELLCGPELELAKSIPSSVGALSSDLPVIKELKHLMEKVDTIKAERETIEFELQNKATTKDDFISQKFMKVFSTQGKINEKEISDDMLKHTYGALEKQANESVRNQDDLVEKIQVANLAFVQEKSKDPNFDAKRRDKFLQELASAYDTYMEILANLKEGIKFYNDLTPILLKFQNKCSDLCFARKTERDELIKDMQDTIINQPAHNYISPYGNKSSNNSNNTSSTTTDSFANSRGPPGRPPPPSLIQSSHANPIQAVQAPNFYAVNSQTSYPHMMQAMPMMPNVYNPYMNYYATNQQQPPLQPSLSYPHNPSLPYPAMQTGYPSAPAYPN